MKTARLGALLVFCLVVLVGCITEPMTGRSTFALISEGEATQMGVQAYGQILADAKLSTDSKTIAMVDRVGRRIAQVTDRYMKEAGREPFQWEFKVIDDPKTANAFALPGGKVAVYTGILPITEDETGLAVVMGHEVAHAYAQHGRKRVSENVIGQMGLGVAEAFLGGDQSSEGSQLIMAGLGLGYKFGVELPFSRGDESAADEIGLYIMAEAGYDPRAAAPFWERMQSMGGQTPPEFLSTHPDPANRIARIQELLPKALELYERSGAATGGTR